MSSPITTQQLSDWIDEPQRAAPWLDSIGIRDKHSAFAPIQTLASANIPHELLAKFYSQVAIALAATADPDRVLADVTRYLQRSINPESMAAALTDDEGSLSLLVRALDISPQHTELLLRAANTFEDLQRTNGQPATREILLADLSTEIVAAHGDFDLCVAAIRRFHQREFLRITHGDLLNQQRFETVVEQNTYLAEAILEAALQAARAIQLPRLGTPPRSSRFVAIGLDSFGGGELDYSGSLDLVCLYDLGNARLATGGDSTTGPKKVAAADYYQRLTQTVLALLRAAADFPVGYDVKVRNATSDANVAMRADDAWKYYDTHGDTWDRLAFIKARPVAGDIELGDELIDRLEPWVYRRYLSQAQIASIRSLKRRSEHADVRDAKNGDDVYDGPNGARDIEIVTQFMQLLNGRDLSEVRVANALQALHRLQEQSCLTDTETSQLTDNYVLLRTVEHRIQVMSDPRSHTLPREPALRLPIARSLGLAASNDTELLDQFQNRLQEATRQNHAILKRLMFDAFGEEASPEPAVDLVLDPDPKESRIQAVLRPHNFKDYHDVYRNLMSLATEKVAFLSKVRCRHFLASIAPQLLTLIAKTPEPDRTLADLSRVSDSLGGKGALWELFRSNPALMELYVRLCAACPYLSGILVRNPGMIDDLMDSLILNQLPSREQLALQASDLCRGAEQLEPILHGFKNAAHLTVGVRDILGKDDIRETTRTLSDIAEICLHHVILSEYEKLVPRLGIPTLTQLRNIPARSSPDDTMTLELPQDYGDCELVVLGLGKLGGREPNYHSDLDVLFVYQADGQTRHPSRGRNRETTSNEHFFSELSQRVTRFMNRLGPWGRLYEIETQFSTWGNKTLSIEHQTLCDFVATKSKVSHRQMLCKARPIFGSSGLRQQVLRDLHQSIRVAAQSPEAVAAAILNDRKALEITASPRNLKRGRGGHLDIEYVVQMLQLEHAADRPQLLVPGTLEGIAALGEVGLLDHDDAVYLAESYRFLRSVEARLRLMDTSSRHDLPTDEAELTKLAYLLELGSGRNVEQRCQHYLDENRRRFDRLFATAGC